MERVQVNLRLPVDTVSKLDDAAETLGVSRNAFMSMVLTSSVGDGSGLRSVFVAALKGVPDAEREVERMLSEGETVG